MFSTRIRNNPLAIADKNRKQITISMERVSIEIVGNRKLVVQQNSVWVNDYEHENYVVLTPKLQSVSLLKSWWWKRWKVEKIIL